MPEPKKSAKESGALFESLKKAADQLNRARDQVSLTIEALNEKLHELNIGIEFCYEKLTEVEQGNIQNFLVYAKVEGGWQLGVRSFDVAGDFLGDQPLSGQSLECRKRAIKMMPSFLQALFNETLSAAEELKSSIPHEVRQFAFRPPEESEGAEWEKKPVAEWEKKPEIDESDIPF